MNEDAWDMSVDIVNLRKCLRIFVAVNEPLIWESRVRGIYSSHNQDMEKRIKPHSFIRSLESAMRT